MSIFAAARVGAALRALNAAALAAYRALSRKYLAPPRAADLVSSFLVHHSSERCDDRSAGRP